MQAYRPLTERKGNTSSCRVWGWEFVSWGRTSTGQASSQALSPAWNASEEWKMTLWHMHFSPFVSQWDSQARTMTKLITTVHYDGRAGRAPSDKSPTIMRIFWNQSSESKLLVHGLSRNGNHQTGYRGPLTHISYRTEPSCAASQWTEVFWIFKLPSL